MKARKNRHLHTYLNLNVRGMGPSATLAINERSRLLRETGQTVYAMGLGQSPFPVPDSVVDALRLAAPESERQPSGPAGGHNYVCICYAGRICIGLLDSQ